MDFVTGLLLSTDWKRDSYNFILVIVDRLIKMVYYKLVKITIDTPGLTKVIINMVMRHNGLLNSIVIDRGSLFTQDSSHLFATFLALSNGFLQPSTCKLTAKPKGKIVP